jgi:hypothetical protein
MALRTWGGSVSSVPETSRIVVDPSPENTSLLSENNSSNRPPCVAVMQATDLR